MLTRGASPPVVVPVPTRAYWVWQAVVGGSFFFSPLITWWLGPVDAPMVYSWEVLNDLVLAIATVAITHRLRPAVLADVADLGGLPRRLPRRAAALVGVALAISTCEVLLRQAMPATPDDLLPVTPSDVALIAVTWSVSLALWCIAYGMSQTISRWRHSVAERRALAAAARQAEARALRAQMDPHFLFNAINSARALVSVDPDGARELLTRYAEILRYVTTHARGTTETLGEALPVAVAYLEIERRRFPDRLRIEVDVPASLQHAQLPTLLLQTLVDNAVRHGIARSVGGGTVGLHARAEDGVLTLTVTNPAPRVTARESSRGDGSGVGLANSRERLRLLHGDAGRLEFAHGPDGVVRVSVHLPFPAASRGAPG